MRYVRIGGAPIFDEEGKFGGYRGTGTDLTSQIEAKCRAARLDQRLRDVFESLPHGIGLFDAGDRLVFCNSKYEEIYPEMVDVMVPGRRIEEIILTGAKRGLFPLEGRELKQYVKDRLEHRLGLGNLVGVRDPEHHVHAALFLGRDVLDHVAPDLVVGHDDRLVIEG